MYFYQNKCVFLLYDIYLRKAPNVENARFSDHLGLRFDLNIVINNRGSGYWKLNTSLLSDEIFCTKLREFLNENTLKLQEIVDARMKWEYVKNLIKNFSMSYSRKKAKEKRKRIRFIESQIQDIEKKLHTDINMRYKRELEKEVDDYYQQKCEGAYIRSRAVWLEKGEKSTSYFLSLEQKQQNDNTINRVKNERGDMFCDNDNIIDTIYTFYKKLYSSRNISGNNIDAYLENVECLSVTEHEKDECDSLPSLIECENAIKLMKNNKSPGLDGLPSEFYKIFWNDIKFYFYESLLKSIESGMLPYTQRNAVISLIFKKGEVDKLKNYRPLSLTNVDYKIFAHVLANRLQKIASRIIGKEQSAYIKGRYIGENARIIMDIFEYCKNNDEDGILLFLDYEKAFDSVEYNFMFKVLEKYNFGKDFIDMIKTLYNDPIFKVKNNGWISKSCKMERGIRQGCPVSALLFIFVLEILATKIRSDRDIKGFTVDGTDAVKIVQHADDCTNALKDEKSLEKTLHIIEEFSHVSGLKLNLEKTECILTGSFVQTYSNETHIQGVKITNSCVKALGVYLGYDKDICYYHNWTSKLEKLERILSVWKRRNLTIFGKSTIVNTLALSKLIYNAFILPNPGDEFFKSVCKLVYNFLWKKRDRIKRHTLIGNIEQGGIGIIDVESKFKAAKASWISRIIDKSSLVHRFITQLLKKHEITIFDVLKTTYCHEKKTVFFDKIDMPTFYIEVMDAFIKCKKVKNVNDYNTDEFLQEIIWNNNIFLHKSEPLCFPNWMSCGILYAKDIFDENGRIHDITYFSNLIKKRQNM